MIGRSSPSKKSSSSIEGSDEVVESDMSVAVSSSSSGGCTSSSLLALVVAASGSTCWCARLMVLVARNEKLSSTQAINLVVVGGYEEADAYVKVHHIPAEATKKRLRHRTSSCDFLTNNSILPSASTLALNHDLD